MELLGKTLKQDFRKYFPLSEEKFSLQLNSALAPTRSYSKITRVANDFWLNYAKKAEPFLGLLWIFDKR
jgi:hypothetical protein